MKSRDTYFAIINNDKIDCESFYDAYETITKYMGFYYEDEYKLIEKRYGDDIEAMVEKLDNVISRMDEEKLYILQETQEILTVVHVWKLERKFSGHYEVTNII